MGLAHVPGNPGAPEHDAGEGVVESVGGGDDADVLGAAFPDAVVGEEFFGFVDAVAELRGPLVDVVEEAEGKVGVDTAGADVGGVQAGAGDALVEFLRFLLAWCSVEDGAESENLIYHELFSFFETP